MAGLRDFIKSNASFTGGAPFLGLDAVGIAASDNKLKAILKTMRDFVLIRVAMVGFFSAVGSAVKGLVRDTGSLDAAFKKLASIQSFSRQLAPLLGGMAAARKHISEILVLEKRGPFKFEELAQASKKLETLTRGGLGIQGLKTVGKVAIATGSDLGQTVGAVGEFYQTLREGQPIAPALEQLRQMGIISQSNADHLTKMAEGGADVQTVLSTLFSIMDKAKKSAAGYKGELASVVAEHEKASEDLKAAFGAPFIESEAKNMQNMTDAAKAFTPVVARISQFLADLYSGFSTAGSATVKWIAESKAAQGIAEGLVKAIGALTVVAVLFGASAAPSLIGAIKAVTASMLTGTTAMYSFGIAIRVLAIGGVLIGVAAALATVGAGIYNFTQRAEQAQSRLKEWADAHREVTDALRKQAGEITNSTEKNEALAKSIEDIIALEKERAEMATHYRPDQPTSFLQKGRLFGAALNAEILNTIGLKSREDTDRAAQDYLNAIRGKPVFTPEDAAKFVESAANQKDRLEIQKSIINKRVVGPHDEALYGAEAERRRNIEDERIQAEMANASPDRRIRLLAELRGHIAGREEEAFGGLEAAQKTAQDRADKQGEIALEKNKGKNADQAKIKKLEGEALAFGLSAPTTSSTFQETKAEMIRRDRDAGKPFSPKELQESEINARMARRREEGAGGFGAEKERIDAQIDAANRELSLTISRAHAEEMIAGLKSEGANRARDEFLIRQRQINDELSLLRQQQSPDKAAILQLESQKLNNQRQEQLRQRSLNEDRSGIQVELQSHAARRAGRTQEAVSLDDLSDFIKRFEALQDKFSPKEAKRLALAQTRDDIMESARPMPHVVASSLARIGGGSGVYAAGGDEVVQLARRQNILMAEANGWLRQIYQREGGID